MSTTLAAPAPPILDARGYIEQRLDDQIRWYDRKSRTNRLAFQGLRVVEILAGATIPLLVGYVKQVPAFQFVVGGLGLLVTVIAGLLALYRFQENWTEYRLTCELLRHEKFMFLTHSTPYNVTEPLSVLVDRAESLISSETNRWAQTMRPPVKTPEEDEASH